MAEINTEEKVFIVQSLDGGMQRKVSTFLFNLSETFLAKNVDFQNIIGGISKTLGYTHLGGTVGHGTDHTLRGCASLNTTGNVNKIMAFVDNTAAGGEIDTYIYDPTTGLWVAADVLFATTSKIESIKFMDQIFVLAGKGTAIQNYDGSTWSTSRNISHMPTAEFGIVDQFRIFLFNINIPVGGNFFSRCWYCDLPKNNAITWNFDHGPYLQQTAGSAVVVSPESAFKTNNIKVGDPFLITSGNNAGEYYVQSVDSQTQITLTETLTYTVATSTFWVGGNWFDVERDNSDVGMGIGKNSGKLLLFKRFSLHRFMKTADATTDYLELVKGVPGTVSHRSIVNIKDWTFYASDTGIWRYDGTTSKLISNSLQEVWDGVPATFYSSIVGWSADDRILKMYVGDVSNTETGLAIAKCLMTYDTQTDTWSVGSLSDAPICNVKWITSSEQKNYVFAAGKCLETEVGNDFDGEPIDMEIETIPYFPIAPEVEVNLTRFRVYTKQGKSLEYSYKLVYFEDNGMRIDDEDRKVTVIDQTDSVANLQLDGSDNLASGFILKCRESSTKVRPVILRIAAYYTGGILK